MVQFKLIMVFIIHKIPVLLKILKIFEYLKKYNRFLFFQNKKLFPTYNDEK